MLLRYDEIATKIGAILKRGMTNWKTDNGEEDRLKKFKQGFFVEWRMANRHKRELSDRMQWVVDTVIEGRPKIVSGDGFRKGLRLLSQEPFRLVPYYAPEVWGGQCKELLGSRVHARFGDEFPIRMAPLSLWRTGNTTLTATAYLRYPGW